MQGIFAFKIALLFTLMTYAERNLAIGDLLLCDLVIETKLIQKQHFITV